MEKIRLLIVDDHAMFREGIARMLGNEPDFAVLGAVRSAGEALTAVQAGNIDIVLLDVDLGSERAADFVMSAKGTGFQGKTLILTAGMSGEEAIQLIRCGVAGIVHKQQSTDALGESIRKVARGEVCLEESYLSSLFRALAASQPVRKTALSERDKAVLRLVLNGLTNGEIGDRLGISEGAAKAALHHVCEKLGVRTRAQVVRVALEQLKGQL